MDTDLDHYGNDGDYDGDSFEDISEEYFGEDFDEENMSLDDIWTYCARPVLSEWYEITTYIILASCFIRLLASSTVIPRTVVHVVSAFLGFYCMLGIMDWHSFYAFTYGVLGLASLFFVDWILAKHRCIYVSIGCLLLIILVGEYELKPVQWNRIRGCVIIMTMKLISVAKDIDDQSLLEMPPLLTLFGYVFNASTVIFGPWVSFEDYMRAIEDSDKIDLVDVQWFVRLAKSLTYSTAFLLMSSCGVQWLLPGAESYGKWMVAFRDAAIFRMSHYFVCYHSESSAIAGGFSRNPPIRDGSGEWDLRVVQPGKIELPHSLVEVVVFWNRPMHIWLKKYVYKPSATKGKLVAILMTFAASALLHGLSFRISAVLISLGFYTFVEFSLRGKLATMLNACVAARPCLDDCGHNFMNGAPLVIAVNLLFSTIALVHLTYLGTMFDHSPEDGLTTELTMGKWSELNFLSFWIFAAMFILNLIF